MLTGVRGVRPGHLHAPKLLARALNYDSATIHEPSVVALSEEGRCCPAITPGRHLDVLELDCRQPLQGRRDARAPGRRALRPGGGPLQGLHHRPGNCTLLSTAAFNSLLKTLEEPPPHAKFIFATTELRKVPVTILSRCQRFDLRRVEPDVIAANLEKIAAAEGMRIEADALALIARAAEGSVRDAQSLLDQALVQADAGITVTATLVRDMLGLADRIQTIELFEKCVRGEAGPAIEVFRTLYGFGADPATVVADLLEHCHGASLARAVGPTSALVLPKKQVAGWPPSARPCPVPAISRPVADAAEAYDEVRRSPDPSAAVEMALIRLCYAADLPGPEEALKALREGVELGGHRRLKPAPSGGGGGGSTGRGGASPKMAVQTAPAISQNIVLQSFEDVVALIDKRRGIALRLNVQEFVRLISFRVGAISFEPATTGAPNNLPAAALGQGLKEWTWPTVAGGGRDRRRRRDPGRAPGQGRPGDPRRGAGRPVRAVGDAGLPRRPADRDPPDRPARGRRGAAPASSRRRKRTRKRDA